MGFSVVTVICIDFSLSLSGKKGFGITKNCSGWELEILIFLNRGK